MKKNVKNYLLVVLKVLFIDMIFQEVFSTAILWQFLGDFIAIFTVEARSNLRKCPIPLKSVLVYVRYGI